MIELHNHLYGSLSVEMVYKMGKNNPNPRWNIFLDLHEKLYSEKIQPDTFFQVFNNPRKIEKLYYFKKPGSFEEFQDKFNLVIAFSRFNPEEIEEMSYKIACKHFSEGILYSEYRLMYSPFATEIDYQEKTIAACKGFSLAEKNHPGHTAKLVLSLHRDNNYGQAYLWLKWLMEKVDIVKTHLVGIDFCAMEEGHPPKNKASFFRQVLDDNLRKPETALSILYHVGESFQDKTPDSAVRWVIEAAEYGAHRLGHCIALGVPPEFFLGQKRNESIDERRDHLDFLLARYEEISNFGSLPEREKLETERSEIESKTQIEELLYTKKEIETLRTLQEYGMNRLKDLGTVVETCPTSNLLIGMLKKKEFLPVRRFSESGLNITISTDDPGILQTSLKKEYAICEKMGIPEEKIKKIQEDSFLYTSELLSNRRNIPYPL